MRITDRQVGTPVVLGLAAVLVCLPACHRHKAEAAKTIEEAPQGLSSVVRMGDPKLAGQLVSGFYGIEANAWRWTGKQFSVEIRPPAGAAQNGALLTLRVTVPEASIQKLQSITLSASINGNTLAPETYTKAGTYVYRRDVQARLLTGDSVVVDFQLDKAMPPGDTDKRELGIVAMRAALEPK